jgi:hypothetical protein
LDSAEGFNFSRSPQRGTFKLVVYFSAKDEEDLFKARGAKPTKAGGTGAGPKTAFPPCCSTSQDGRRRIPANRLAAHALPIPRLASRLRTD